jgi:hypothetical protein
MDDLLQPMLQGSIRMNKSPILKGYQLWETTSEGNPASPVFKTLDEWYKENATVFGSHKATKEKWKSMLDENFVCHQ